MTAISAAVTEPMRRIRSGSRAAPSPIFCGKIVAPTMLAWPWTASIPNRLGIAGAPPARGRIAASQIASASFSHSGAGALSLLPGPELPPAKYDPNR